MARLLVWTLISLALCSRADRFAENVADFALQSLNRLFTTDHPILLDHRSATVPNNGFYNLQGALRNSTLSGLNSISNITTHVKSITIPGECNLEYSFIIVAPVISGNYEISGYVGSPVLPFEGAGDFQITLFKEIDFNCTVTLTSISGFLQFENRCSFLTWPQVEVEDAQLNFTGIVKHPLLDPKLILSILQDIVKYCNDFSFRSSISDAVPFLIEKNLAEDFQTRKFLDIILADQLEQVNHHHQHSHYTHKFLQDKEAESNRAMEDRLCSFVIDTIHSLSDSTEDPLPLGSLILYLENSSNALFPSRGILSNLKLSGLRAISQVNCTLWERSEMIFNIEFDMLNMTLTGMFNITGSIAGKTTVSSTGEFNIFSEKGGTFFLNPRYRSINGYFSHVRTSTSGFSNLSETYVNSFPDLLNGFDVNPEVYKVIVNSIGDPVFTHSALAEPLLAFIVKRLQNRFFDVPIVNIITIS